MGKDSKIEWTHHTFNPWLGCTKVSDGCKHCYAEVYGNRFGVQWGPGAMRRRTSKAYWKQPLTWNARCERMSITERVFCASLADVFEGKEETLPWLRDLLHLIERCSSLNWLLLTKRPANVVRLIAQSTGRHAQAWLEDCSNVWIGTSVENQAAADERIPQLLEIPAAVRFLSCEPLLGWINLFDVSGWRNVAEWWGKEIKIDWVICGGESGPGARYMSDLWVTSLRDQCIKAAIPFFFKQWGGVHKHTYGRELDGRTWDETPKR